MAVYYFDSSAIVKRYIMEAGTNWVIATSDPASGSEILISLLARAEVPTAIFKRSREGAITASDATIAAGDFASDFDSRYQPMDLTRHVVEQAASLAEKRRLRG